MIGFDDVFEVLIGHEGGYVDHPNDPGGATRYGITERVAREYGYMGRMEALPLSTAKEIYKSRYWGRARCEEFDIAIGFQVFDAAVNHGIGNSIRFLQRAVGVVDDGVVGPITIEAVNNKTVLSVIMKFNSERLMFYTKLSTWSYFGKGWARRIADNLEIAAND